MDLSPRILGAHVAKALGERAAAPVLRLGSDSFDRRDLAAVACFNFIAAANLSRALATIRPPVKNTRDVFERVPPSALAVPGVGAIALAVLGAAFEQKHLGGDHPLEAWITTHRAAGPRREFVTFDTLKHRTADREPADRRARRHARRNEAHGLRVARFTKRQKVKTA